MVRYKFFMENYKTGMDIAVYKSIIEIIHGIGWMTWIKQ